VIETLTGGGGSKVCQRGNSRMMMERHREHLEGFERYAGAIVRRLEGMRR
jgi:hypothetical protein